jgi:streptogrisin C
MGGHRLDVTRKDPKGETQWGGCSVGFNIKAEKTGQPFVLTAGHCVIGENHPDDFADKAYHNGIPVAQKEGSIRKIQKGDSGTQESVDYAFLPYQVDGETNWGDYWINRRPKKNAIFIRCEAGAKPCDPHVTYIEGIGQFNNVTEGTVLCHSGSANDETNKGTENANYRPGTRCGAVKGKGGQVDRVFVMDICSRPGDSGGPLFSQTDRLAYGLLRGWIKGLTNECKVSHEKDKTDFTVLEFTLADAEKESGQTLGLRVFNSRDNT